MKFRALKLNYYAEAKVMIRQVAGPNCCTHIIEAGSYLNTIIDSKNEHSSMNESNGNVLTVSRALTDLAKCIDSNLSIKSSATTAVSKNRLQNNCSTHSPGVANQHTYMISMKQNIIKSDSFQLPFKLPAIAICVASDSFVSAILQTIAHRTNTKRISATPWTLIDNNSNIVSSNNQERALVPFEFRAKGSNYRTISLSFTSVKEPQSQSKISTPAAIEEIESSKCEVETRTLKKQQPDVLLLDSTGNDPQNKNNIDVCSQSDVEIIPSVMNDIPTTGDDNLYARNIVGCSAKLVCQKKTKSKSKERISSKERKAKKREKRKRSRSELDVTVTKKQKPSGPETQASYVSKDDGKAKKEKSPGHETVAANISKGDGKDTLSQQTNLEPLVITLNKRKLGDIDNELDAIRDKLKSKASNSSTLRQALPTSISQRGFPATDLKMKWKSWNDFLRDNDKSTSRPVATTLVNSASRLATSGKKPDVLEGQKFPSSRFLSNDLGGQGRENGNRTNPIALRQEENSTSHEPLRNSKSTFGHQLAQIRQTQSSTGLQSSGENPVQHTSHASQSEHLSSRKSQASSKRDTLQSKSIPNQVNVLCSESFLETWGDVVAAIVSGKWIDLESAGSLLERTQDHTVRHVSENISFIDTPLLNNSGIDIEAPSNCSVFILPVVELESSDKAKVIVLKLAELAAIGRYSKIYVFFYVDKEISPTMTTHMVKIQFAISTPHTQVLCKTATSGTLAASLANTILRLPVVPYNEDYILECKDHLVIDRAKFLMTILPVVSASGALRCLALAKHLMPMGSPYFEIMLKNQRLRQQMKVTLLTEDHKDLNPAVLVQLSYMLDIGRNKQPTFTPRKH